MRTWVRSLASLSGLRIWRWHELWRRLQTRLGSDIAVAVVSASSYGSDSASSLGTSVCHGGVPKKNKGRGRGKRHDGLLGCVLCLSITALCLSPPAASEIRVRGGLALGWFPTCFIEGRGSRHRVAHLILANPGGVFLSFKGPP